LGFINILVFFGLAVAGVLVGARLAEAPKISRKVLAASGGLLIGISLIWVLPEVAAHSGWLVALLWVAAGFGLLWIVDHYVYPICPACSHSHDHDGCSAPLHGFAGPLLIAIGIHSFLDGWGLAASQQSTEFVKLAFLLGVGLHKFPEGLALGAIVRASVASHGKALICCIAAEAMTLVGGAVGLGIAAGAGASWEAILLAAASGTFIYLGYHAVEGEVQRWFARGHVHADQRQ
jgi:zinc transporter ZupT